MRAGYLNRVRSYRFLLILVLCIIAGYVFVPAPDANYVTLGWGSSTAFYRGVYNSAWIGSLVAMLSGMFLALFGFYVVNDAVKRDETTGVGQVIATAPLGNPVYTLGTALGNFLVLGTMVFIVFLTALAMQLVRGEMLVVDFYALAMPFIVIVFPLMFLVAAIAVLFETVPFLSRGVGNMVYVMLCLFSVPILFESLDLIGNKTILSSMGATGEVLYPEMQEMGFILGYSWGFPEGRALETFTWNGVHWTMEILQTKLLMIVVAVGIVLIASLLFSRFDPSRESNRPSVSPMTGIYMEPNIPTVTPVVDVELKPLEEKEVSFGFGSMLLAECKLMLREFPSVGSMGLLGAATLIVAGILLPEGLTKGMLLLVAWLVPVLYWSRLGTREYRHGTRQLVFSSAEVLVRQFWAMWLTGVIISFASGGGVMLSLGLRGDIAGLAAVIVGALFIPSLALFMGVWSGSNKMFEFLYTLLWYIGPMNGVVPLDFMGVVPGSVEAGVWLWYLGATVILVGLAFIGRRLQLQD
jgi:hypothetical protein